MARLDIVRQYFIERFLTAIGKAVALNAGLNQPAELFTGSTFNVTPDATGFARIPTLQSLEQRIASAADPQVKAGLTTFRDIVAAASVELTFGLGPVAAANLLQLAKEYVPQIRQYDTMTFWPVAVGDYLNYDDGTLTGYFYDASGRTALRGKVFDTMFQNPSIPSAGSFPPAPYKQRVPFVATVGIEPTVPAYPTSPLNVGQLNLTAADARFYPGAQPPTVYAEFKALSGGLAVNRNYLAAAATGRFSDLSNNRLHLDPDPRTIAGAAQWAPGLSTVNLPDTADPVLLVYHVFYPIDDEARKTGSVDAHNREGHHLGAGILLQGGLDGDVALRPSKLFYCAGPDDIRIVPFDHPGLQFLHDSRHIVLYAGWGTPLKLQLDNFFSSTAVTISGQNVSVGDAIIGGLLMVVAVAGACAGGALATVVGVGAAAVCAVVAIVAAALALLVFLACLFFIKCGQPESSNPPPDQYQPQTPDNDTHFQNANTYLTPSGSGQPGQTFELALIPHALDQNLYGLIGATAPTFAIQDNPDLQQMLGWAAFPGGFGYQVERAMPGASDSPGSQWRNYYSLFVSKIAELEIAQSLVSYFGP
ncbi:MAG TPA: hypothetical protein VK749_19230 [Xanthobacteraceae bacterium]|jgi:hypothetical protein|nr:hypothetical protein [Xanthobacteraceae bacterium]